MVTGSGSQRQARTPGEKAVYAPENDAVPHEGESQFLNNVCRCLPLEQNRSHR